MPAIFIGMLVGALAQAMASLVGRALIALGIGYVTYSGVSAGMDTMYSAVKSAYGGLPGEVAGLFSWLWVDKAISVVVSSYTVALSFKLINGSITKMVIKK